MVKFSIIIPVYNVEKYLSECVDSVLKQTFRDFELILVDDGSKDSSPEICDRYSSQDERVKVIHKPNGGQSDARNRGFEIAGGEYVYFMDSDDYLIDEHVFQKISDVCVSEPDIIAFDSIKWFESTGNVSECRYNMNVTTKGRRVSEVLRELIDRDAFHTAAWSKFVRTALLRDNGISFVTGFSAEDNDWYYQVLLHVKKIQLINEPFYVYRQRQGSVTKSICDKPSKDLFYFIRKWTKLIATDRGIDHGMGKVIMLNIAKQYCNVLIGFADLPDLKQQMRDLKKYTYLLKLSKNKRVVIFRWVYRFIGLRGLLFLLRIAKKYR